MKIRLALDYDQVEDLKIDLTKVAYNNVHKMYGYTIEVDKSIRDMQYIFYFIKDEPADLLSMSVSYDPVENLDDWTIMRYEIEVNQTYENLYVRTGYFTILDTDIRADTMLQCLGKYDQWLEEDVVVYDKPIKIRRRKVTFW